MQKLANERERVFMKEYNITLSEALTFLNERHFTKKGSRTYTDSSSPFLYRFYSP